jgi:hypothetical protein
LLAILELTPPPHALLPFDSISLLQGPASASAQELSGPVIMLCVVAHFARYAVRIDSVLLLLLFLLYIINIDVVVVVVVVAVVVVVILFGAGKRSLAAESRNVVVPNRGYRQSDTHAALMNARR